MEIYIVRPFGYSTGIGTEAKAFASVDALLTWYGHEGIVTDEHGKEARIYNRAIIKVKREPMTNDLLGVAIKGEERLYHVAVTDLHE